MTPVRTAPAIVLLVATLACVSSRTGVTTSSCSQPGGDVELERRFTVDRIRVTQATTARELIQDLRPDLLRPYRPSGNYAVTRGIGTRVGVAINGESPVNPAALDEIPASTVIEIVWLDRCESLGRWPEMRLPRGALIIQTAVTRNEA